MRPSPPGSGVPPPRGLPRGGGTPDPSAPGEIPILDTDPDPGVFGKRWTLQAHWRGRCDGVEPRDTAASPDFNAFLNKKPARRDGVAGPRYSSNKRWKKIPPRIEVRCLLSSGPRLSVPPPVLLAFSLVVSRGRSLWRRGAARPDLTVQPRTPPESRSGPPRLWASRP